MRRTLHIMTCLSAMVVLIAGSVAAQSQSPASIQELNPAVFDPSDGRIFTHSVLSELGAPTG